MALWKPFRGNSADLDAVEKHDGWIYFCIDNGALFFDYTDADGNLQRKQINAKDAETIMGASLDDALAQAKASGEFDGADGISVTHIWNGTTLSVTSASGTSSANLKGDKGDKGDTGSNGAKGDKGDTGDAGYTPVRGTDYWTDADKAEIKSYVDDAILNGAW